MAASLKQPELACDTGAEHHFAKRKRIITAHGACVIRKCVNCHRVFAFTRPAPGTHSPRKRQFNRRTSEP